MSGDVDTTPQNDAKNKFSLFLHNNEKNAADAAF